MINKVIIVGNVGKEAEMRFTPNGNTVTTCSVASNETFTKDNEKQTISEWFSVITWGKLAETCNTYIHKGMLVYVEGKLQTRKWQDSQGNFKYRTELVASTVRFLSRQENEQSNTQGEQSEETESEDVPF